MADDKKIEIPAPVRAALKALIVAARENKIAMEHVLPVSPNQALMWEMSDEVQRLRRILNYQLPGWDDPL